MQKGVDDFKSAVQSTGEFRPSVRVFLQQLPKGQRVEIKKLSIKIPKAVVKGGGSVGDSAAALVRIFKAFEDMEKLPFKVNKITLECLQKVMELDLSDLAGGQGGGGVAGLAKMPKRIDDMRKNVKEIQEKPKIVCSSFEYASAIVKEVVKVFCDDNKNEELLNKRREKVNNDTKKTIEEIEKILHPKPPEEINFASLGIPTIDEIFRDIAQQVNPVIELSRDLFNARDRLEKAMKAISEFRDDPSKAFDDYLEELKKRIKKGECVPAVCGSVGRETLGTSMAVHVLVLNYVQR